MIVGFADADTKLLWETGKSRRIPANLRISAFKKLAILNAALELNNLSVPPGNRLEALKDDRKGQHSIRVNDQYRVCFRWSDGNAHDGEIVDYHEEPEYASDVCHSSRRHFEDGVYGAAGAERISRGQGDWRAGAAGE